MNNLHRTAGLLLFLSLVASLIAGCRRSDSLDKCIYIGHFPNVTHAQALVERRLQSRGEGFLQKRLPGYTFEWYTFNAGPSAMEALFGKTLDVTYVGPAPAINAYAVSGGREVRILAGAAKGGSALLVSGDSSITQAADFKGNTIATPQLGNTQDVAARAWFRQNGLSSNFGGIRGDVIILPTANAMMMQLLRQKSIAGCWTVEPWVSRLEAQVDARIVLEEPEAVTTILVGRREWVRKHPQEATALKEAHRELTRWMREHPVEAQTLVVEELRELTQTYIDPELIARSWERLNFDTAIDLDGMLEFVKNSRCSGLLKSSVPPITGMVEEH